MEKNNILKAIAIFMLLISSCGVNAQESKKLYEPSLDGMKQTAIVPHVVLSSAKKN